jgi:hypothetical protein
MILSEEFRDVQAYRDIRILSEEYRDVQEYRDIQGFEGHCSCGKSCFCPDKALQRLYRYTVKTTEGNDATTVACSCRPAGTTEEQCTRKSPSQTPVSEVGLAII